MGLEGLWERMRYPSFLYESRSLSIIGYSIQQSQPGPSMRVKTYPIEICTHGIEAHRKRLYKCLGHIQSSSIQTIKPSPNFSKHKPYRMRNVLMMLLCSSDKMPILHCVA